MIRIDTVRKRSFIINFAYFVILAALTYGVVKYALPLLSPFVLAFLFACMLQRPIRFLHRALRFPQRLCGVMAAILFFVVIGGVISLVGNEIITGIQNLIEALPDFYNDFVEPLMLEIFSRIENAALWNNDQIYELVMSLEEEILSSAGELVSTISAGAVGAISDIAASLPMMFIKLVLLIIATVFISMDYDKLLGFCMDQMSPSTQNLFIEVKNYVVGTLFVCIRSYALIMSITCAELCIGLTIIGIDHAVLIAIGIAIFDILPVLGTGGIMIPWSVINVVLGNYSLAASLIILYVAITIIRNILEPKIVGKQLGLHPVVTLASMFAGVQLLGVIGLFGFPIFLSLLLHLNDKGIIGIFKGRKAAK